MAASAPRTSRGGTSTVRAPSRRPTSSRSRTPSPPRPGARPPVPPPPRPPPGRRRRRGRPRQRGRPVRVRPAPGHGEQGRPRERPTEDPALLARCRSLEDEGRPEPDHARCSVAGWCWSSSRSTYAFSRQYAAAEAPSVCQVSSDGHVVPDRGVGGDRGRAGHGAHLGGTCRRQHAAGPDRVGGPGHLRLSRRLEAPRQVHDRIGCRECSEPGRPRRRPPRPRSRCRADRPGCRGARLATPTTSWPEAASSRTVALPTFPVPR